MSVPNVSVHLWYWPSVCNNCHQRDGYVEDGYMHVTILYLDQGPAMFVKESSPVDWLYNYTLNRWSTSG